MTTIKPIGIPYEEVGSRLKELDEAIRECDMALGAETDIHLTVGPVKDRVVSATITVYFLQEEETEKLCSTCRYGAECPDGPRCKKCDNGSKWMNPKEEEKIELACKSCKWCDTYHENGELVYNCHNRDIKAIRDHKCYAPKEAQ